MTKTKAPVQKLIFTPRNPAVWGSVDTWGPGRQYQATVTKLTAEMQIRAGRDSAEEGYRIWSRIELVSGDKILLSGKQFLVVYAHSDSSGGINYYDVRGV